MDMVFIVAQIDAEISRLQQARAALASISPIAMPKRRGRPAKNSSTTVAPLTKKRKPLSTEGRARIAAAQKKRWADHKKAIK